MQHARIAAALGVPWVVRIVCMVNEVLQQGYVDAQCCKGTNVRCERCAPASMRALQKEQRVQRRGTARKKRAQQVRGKRRYREKQRGGSAARTVQQESTARKSTTSASTASARRTELKRKTAAESQQQQLSAAQTRRATEYFVAGAERIIRGEKR